MGMVGVALDRVCGELVLRRRQLSWGVKDGRSDRDRQALRPFLSDGELTKRRSSGYRSDRKHNIAAFGALGYPAVIGVASIWERIDENSASAHQCR